MALVFDFDGVFTDATRDAAFVTAFRAVVHERLDTVLPSAVWDRAVRLVSSSPSEHGWWRDGRIVASACDVFLLEQAAARALLLERGRDEVVAEEILDEAFGAGWRASHLRLRDGVSVLADRLHQRGLPWYVITNADPARVASRLKNEGLTADSVNIVGFARKDIVDPRVQVSGKPYGLDRPLFHVRSAYIGAIDHVRTVAKCGIADLVFIGDNAELDLLTPASLGAQVALVEHGLTLDWERRWLQTLGGRGRLLSSLLEVIHESI